MADLTEMLLRRRRAAMVFIFIFLAMGIVSFFNIPVSFYPQVNKPRIGVRVKSSGQTAVDLYTRYSTDIDNIMDSIEDVEKITARYSINQIYYSIEFPWNYDIQDAKDKVYAISPRLEAVFPDDNINNFRTPEIWAETESSSNFTAALYSDTLTSEQLYQEAKNLLQGTLNRNVRFADSIWFVPIQRVAGEVHFDVAQMLKMNLTPKEVIDAVSDRYLDTTVGNFRDGNTSYSMRYLSDMKDIYELENVIVTTVGSQTIRLKDVANVSIEKSLPKRVYRVNGETAVIIGATSQPDGNIRTMSEDMRREISAALPSFSGKVSLEVVEDPAQFINQSLAGLVNSILQGSILAVAVTLLFLGVFKNAVIVIVSLPLSLIYSFVLMRVFGVSINLISLSGMALAVGMTVDAAVVIVENIHRHRTEQNAKGKKVPLFQLITESVKEVRLSIIASLLTSVCVFLPLTFTAALANALLGDLAKVVVFALITSLIVSLTMIPLLYYYLFRENEKPIGQNHPWMKKWHEITSQIEQYSAIVTGFVKHYYGKILFWLLFRKQARKRQIWVLAGITGLFFFSLLLFSTLKVELVSSPQSALISLSARNTDYTEMVDFLEALDPITEQIQEILGKHLRSMFMGTSSSSRADYVLTIDKRKHTPEMIERLESQLGADGWSFSVAQYDPATLPLPQIYALHLRITGPDRFKVLEYMEQLQDQIMRLTNEKRINKNTKMPESLYLYVITDPSTMVSNELGLKLRPETLSYLNLKENVVVNTARVALTRIRLYMDHQGDEIRINFRYPPITNREEAMNILIPYKNTGIPLSHFFEPEPQVGIASILVEDQQEVYNLKAMVRQDEFNPVAMNAYAKRVQKEVLDNFQMEPGYAIVHVDAQKDLRVAINSLNVALLLSVLFIFLILAVQFNSYRLPIIISSTLPLGVAGAAIALFVGRSTLSINSVLGIILLGGIAVNNSIMIVDFYLHMPKSVSKEQAIYDACLLRITPILTSVLTTVLGMLPLALAIGDGSNVIQPLGIAVSGGLTISTLLTMISIPAILSLTKRPELDNVVE